MKSKWFVCIALLLYAGCVLKSQPAALRGDTLCFHASGCNWILPVESTSSAIWETEMQNSQEWIQVQKVENAGIRILMEPNQSEHDRYASIRIYSDEEEEFIPILQLCDHKIQIDFHQQFFWIQVNSAEDSPWTASVNEDAIGWARATRHGHDAILLELAENKGRTSRELQVFMKDGEKILKSFPVVQNYNPLPVTPLYFSVGNRGGNISIYSAISDSLSVDTPDWICLENQISEGEGMQYELKVQGNDLKKVRTDSIRIGRKSGTGYLKIPVSQYGYTDYAPVEVNRLNDTLLKVASGEASSFQPGEEIERSFDGDASTIYHSSWYNNQPGYFPITLTYRFAEPETMDYIIYHPRMDGGLNGSFKTTDVLVQTAGSDEFRLLKQVELKGNLHSSRIDFPERLQHVTAVRFVVHSGAGADGGYASCSEMEFYRKPEINFHYQDLFADVACTKLKRGIKVKDIEQCREPFFQNLAMSIYQKCYDAEFRIQKYRAWMNPDIQAGENGTQPFSLLDNPTGIAATAGEPLVVMVEDNIPGLALQIQDLSAIKNGLDGYGGVTYELRKGLNVIRPIDSGLCYVLYHSEHPETEKPVTIHFASGHVNGYFDVEKHGKTKEDSRWNELLQQAGNKYFDVLSPHVHFTFRKEDFLRYVPDVYALLAAYDTLVCHEMEFEGLNKYNRRIKNRVYIHTTYAQILYASSYHIGFQEIQLPELLNPETLKSTHCWGPAHELGHMLQVYPSLNWTGMTEVTNNIQSMEIQRLWGNPSRLHEDLRAESGFTDTYEKAMNIAFVNKKPYDRLSDWFVQLVPLWQLRLYLMDVCGQEDFYKDLYEISRRMNHRADLSGGQWQLEFVYNSCVTSGMDLRPFFRKWGWLTPTEREDGDGYGNEPFEVTEEDLIQINARIDALNLPKLKHAAEYITDNTLELYTQPKPLVAGTAEINPESGQVCVRGASGAVAFEVYCGTELCGVSHCSEFFLNSLKGKVLEDIKVIAVSCDGKKLTIR